jgi:NAD(P)H-dependent FMN reductase
LKNALDYAYAEWSNKPVAFVGYGGVGGARTVEQLRLHTIELQMAPIRSAVHILFPDYLAVIKDGKPLSKLEHLNQAARQMLDQMAWWTRPQSTREEFAPRGPRILETRTRSIRSAAQPGDAAQTAHS